MALHEGARPPGARTLEVGAAGYGMLNAVAALVRRDLHLALRQGMDSLMAVVFFVLACCPFPSASVLSS